MNKLITILAVVFAGFSAQALQLPNNSMIPAIENIALEADTQVVQIDVRSRDAVNCPGSLDLKKSLNSKGQVSILMNNQRSEVFHEIMGGVSKSCKQEIFEFMAMPKKICLSFGHEGGRVYIDVRNLSADIEALEVILPVYLKIENSVQLK